MEAIRWGIIGCGNVTEVKSGPAFNKVPNSSLVAVMRRDGAKAMDYAKRHKVPKWYDDAFDLLHDETVNAIYIATPPSSHLYYAIEAFKAGKPVYVEKPMALNTEEALEMQKAALHYQQKLCIAHYRRAMPVFEKIAALLKEQAIGTVLSVDLSFIQPPDTQLIASTENNWRLNAAVSGGGLFHDLAPHQLDLMIHFFGAPLYASGFALNRSHLYDAADAVNGLLLFEHNISFRGEWNFTAPVYLAKDACIINGTEGYIQFSIFNNAPLVLCQNKEIQTFHFDTLEHVQQPMIRKVVEYFSGEAENPCPAAEGIAGMKIIDGFTKSGKIIEDV